MSRPRTTSPALGIVRAPLDAVTDAFGYAASAILVLTISAQIREQWRRHSTEGVSPLLFIGQIAASAGFVVHSAMIGSGLFVVTNVIVGVAAFVGMVIYVMLSRRTDAHGAPPPRREGVGDRARASVPRGSPPPRSSEEPSRACRPAPRTDGEALRR